MDAANLDLVSLFVLEELEYIISEMGGDLETFDCYDKSRNWKKIIIEYNFKEK